MTLLIKGTDFCAHPECERLDGGEIIGGLFYCTEHALRVATQDDAMVSLECALEQLI